MRTTQLIETMIPISVLILSLYGCTSLEESEAKDTESLLSATGFKMKLADTPAKKKQIDTLPQRRISHLNRDGRLIFVYADGEFCKCLYVGNQAQYQEFQKLRLQTDIAAEESIAAENADIAWGTWD